MACDVSPVAMFLEAPQNYALDFAQNFGNLGFKEFFSNLAGNDRPALTLIFTECAKSILVRITHQRRLLNVVLQKVGG